MVYEQTMSGAGPSFGLESGHGDIVVGLVEMGQEENVRESQPVNGELLLDGQRKKMDGHGDIVPAGQLGAQDNAGVGIVDNFNHNLFIVVLNKLGLL